MSGLLVTGVFGVLLPLPPLQVVRSSTTCRKGLGMQDERRDDVAAVDVAVALSEIREKALNANVNALQQ